MQVDRLRDLWRSWAVVTALVPFFSIAPTSDVVAQTSSGVQSRAGAAAVTDAKPGPPRFEATTFDEVPGWRQDDHAAALQAFLRSCPILISASRAGNRAGAVAISPALLSVCDLAIRYAGTLVSPESARAFFETQFKPHRVVHSGPAGMLTGYYEPVIEGSRTRTSKFTAPVLRRPPELLNVVDESQRGAKSSVLTHVRQTDKGVVPFATRAEIEQGALNGRGLEIMWLVDPVDVFFMQIQGSGRIKLPDGAMVRLSYDGKNGHPYTSIGRHLIDAGHFTIASMSLGSLADWLKADRERGQRVMWQNKSFVFFRELAGEEAKGALGVLHIPLSPGRSLAVDAGVHAIGTPVYVQSTTLTHAGNKDGFNRLMIAQDVGSAIKGPERGDIYFGSGPEAGKLAGVTKHAAQFFVLLPATAAAKPSDAPRTEDKLPATTVPSTFGATSFRSLRDP